MSAAAPVTEPPLVVPRLSILHLFLWTTFTAIAMACAFSNRIPFPTPLDSDLEQQVVVLKLLQAIMAVVDGAAITGFSILFPIFHSAAKRRQLQPGHWILLCWGVFAIGACLWNGTMGLWYRLDDWGLSPALSTSGGKALQYGSVLLFAVPAWRLCRPRRSWTIYFGLRATGAAIFSLSSLIDIGTRFVTYSSGISPSVFGPFGVFIMTATAIGGLIELAAFVAFVVAAVSDLRTGPRRDWLHQAGVLMVAAFPLLSIMNSLVIYFTLYV